MVTKDFWVLLAMVIYFVAMLTIGFIYSSGPIPPLVSISRVVEALVHG